MRTLFALALAPLLALAALPALAVDHSSPRAVVEALYEPYFQDFESFDYELLDNPALRSAALNDLYARDREDFPDGIGRLDFDPYVDGQDFELTDLVVGEPVITGDQATVTATFANFGEPRSMILTLVDEDGWKIDNVESTGGGYTYSLREILEQPLVPE